MRPRLESGALNTIAAGCPGAAFVSNLACVPRHVATRATGSLSLCVRLCPPVWLAVWHACTGAQQRPCNVRCRRRATVA
jgi:hypothetical protein